jgi:hypothetical protein
MARPEDCATSLFADPNPSASFALLYSPLLQAKNLPTLPPPRDLAIRAPRTTHITALLHRIRDSPPLQCRWIAAHSLHVSLKVCAAVREGCKEPVLAVEEDAVVAYVAFLDLCCDSWGDWVVDSDVFGQVNGLDADGLGEATVGGGHCDEICSRM